MTNEEKLTKAVTPAVLEEFYNGNIAPYLNPAIQHWNRSDIYSTDEKMIGQWIDKRPLYQKTIDCGSGPNNTSKAIAHNISNVNEIVKVEGYCNSGGSYFLPLVWLDAQSVGSSLVIFADKTNVYLRSQANRTADYCYVTIRYTKTTDSPLTYTLGNPYDYSLDERLIGTWIDGKPLYQKTVNFGTLPNNTTKIVAHGISNLKRVIHAYGYGYNSEAGYNVLLPTPMPSYADVNNPSTGVYFDKDNIYIESTGNRSGFTESYVILQYTKTTDA